MIQTDQQRGKHDDEETDNNRRFDHRVKEDYTDHKGEKEVQWKNSRENTDLLILKG